MRLLTVLALAIAAVSMTFAQSSSKQIVTTGGNVRIEDHSTAPAL